MSEVDFSDNYGDTDRQRADSATKTSAVMLNDNSQYQIAKKKELLVKKLDQLRKNNEDSETQ